VFGLWQLDDLQLDAKRRLGGGLLAGISLVDGGERDAITSPRVHGRRQRADLGPVLLVRRRDVQGQQVAQRVDGGMKLRPSLPFVAVVPGPRAAFGGAAQSAAIQDHRRWGIRPPLRPAQHCTQVVHHGVADTRRDPALGLLINGGPGRKVGWQQALRGPGTNDPAQRIEDLAQIVMPLGSIWGHQDQVRGDEGPFIISDIGGIGISGKVRFHNPSLPSA